MTRLPFHVLLDPDAAGFRNPDNMAIAIDGYCRQTDQPALTAPPSYARAIMESLAFKYRTVLESLEEITGQRFDEIRVVGGGARNRLLNQFTANATGRMVVAGPVEATALGNVAMQMLATGAVHFAGGSQSHHRPIVSGGTIRADRCRSVGAAIPPIPGIRGVHSCLK